jgi:hypothetical protein
VYVNELSFDPRDPTFETPGLPEVRWAVQVFTTRNLFGLAPERTHLAADGDGLRLVCDGLTWAGQQRRASGRVEVHLARRDGALCWQAEARHDEPVKVVKLLLHGLPEDALAQGWWTPTTAVGDLTRPAAALPLSWRYPWPEWLTPWACAGEGSGAVCLSVRDPEVRAKRLYVHLPPYTDGRPVVELACEEDARRWGNHFAAPEVRLRICAAAAEVDADFDDHLAFVERAFAVPRWEDRPDVPTWMRDVRLVLNLHGQHWTGYVFNTFDRMGEALRFVTRHIPGEQVLAYVPGWEGRYYFAYPFYRPGEDLGGEAGFRRLLTTARSLGVRVMPMFGANGANAQLYPDWEQAAFRNRTGRVVRLINCPDWDTDRAGEDDQVFLNPGEPGFRAHLCRQVSEAVTSYDLDGVFLDTSACWFNDPRHNVYDGYRELLAELRRQHPGVLFAGEGWWDALLALFPVNQSWLGVDRVYRRPELLTRYGRALGHLAEGTPGPGSTGVHEGGFRPGPRPIPTFGHIPSLGIVDDTLERYADEIAAICHSAAERSVRAAGD